MIEELGALLPGVEIVTEDEILWVVKPYLTFWGLIGAISQGFIAVLMLLAAERAGKEKPKKNQSKQKHGSGHNKKKSKR